MVEVRQPGVVAVHYEWAEQLGAPWQAELLEVSRSAAAGGPVALVFVLADRIREIPPTVRGFWRTTCSDRDRRIAAMAIVTASWGVEVEAAGFGVTNALSGEPLQVRTFGGVRDAEAWASSVVRPRPVATRA